MTTQSPLATRTSAAAHVAPQSLDDRIDLAMCVLIEQQRPDGHWVFELEADATIPSEYVLLQHYLGDLDSAVEAKIAVYLRRTRTAEGGWPLYPGGPLNISASVKAYLALKVIGDAPEEAHMRAARSAILAHGGAGATNVFTRILLALFGVLPWSSVPIMPVEMLLLPRWPFHLSRISYWSRTVLVPLLVLGALRPRARNPRRLDIPELFPHSRGDARRCVRAPHQGRLKFAAFAAVDAFLRVVEPLVPARLRRRAIESAVAFVTERLNGEHGLGAIFPAMANALMMFDALGYSRSHPHYMTARKAVDALLVHRADETYCQPCVSAVWDTVLSCHALLEAGGERANSRVRKALAWLQERQVLETIGDWAAQRPGVRPGGWAFQYANAHYPDLDDTAAVVLAMDRVVRGPHPIHDAAYQEAIARGREWVLGLQSRNGGWGAFDADNTSEYLNHIPFADHGALLDPPTADVTARCVSMLAQLGRASDDAQLRAGLEFLKRAQERDGSWYGRWGMNYIYGTWSVLCALNATGADLLGADVRRAVDWLTSIQNDDGGWGEGADSYELDYRAHSHAVSTPSQTAWALLGLMAAGDVGHPAVKRGVDYLLRTQAANGAWPEDRFNATGFPRVFYLHYHGYPTFFPLWALARYRNLHASGERHVRFGM